MSSTTIKLHLDTKNQLDSFREYRNESYDEVVRKVIFIAENVKEDPELSKETIKAIENARKRIKAGNFIREEDARKRLGF